MMFPIFVLIYFDAKIFSIIIRLNTLPIEYKFNNTFIFFPSRFTDNSFSFNNSFKSVSISLFSFLMELVRNKTFVSSPKWCTLQDFIALCKSFIYSKNRQIPGTSYMIEEKEE